MTRTWSKDELANLFGSQITDLRHRGQLKDSMGGIEENPVIWTLTKQKDQVIEKTSKMKFKNGCIPFLPVIIHLLDIHKLMSMVVNENGAGYTYVDPKEIIDLFETPENCYYVYNVENGNAMRNKKPEEAKEIIEKQRRRGLTCFEIISLGILNNVLFSHNVYGLGSYSGSPSAIPALWLYDKGNGRSIPRLSCLEIRFPSEKWGAPSCEDEGFPRERKIKTFTDERDKRVQTSKMFLSI